jgi:hypothetical protein
MSETAKIKRLLRKIITPGAFLIPIGFSSYTFLRDYLFSSRLYDTP